MKESLPPFLHECSEPLVDLRVALVGEGRGSKRCLFRGEVARGTQKDITQRLTKKKNLRRLLCFKRGGDKMKRKTKKSRIRGKR